MLIVRTPALDIYRHLALEECLLELAPERGPILYLWRSAGAVVIGKNQNPWRECRLAALPAEGCVLARRSSGGGAVYHDAGNLNYTLVLPRAQYHQTAVLAGLVAALQGAGIPAQEGPHHSLMAHGRKFSGHAFCFRRAAALHHGTLLVDADLSRLQRCFAGGLRLATRAVASHPAPVVNLATLRPGLDIPAVEEVVVAALSGLYPGAVHTAGAAWLEALPWRPRRARHADWAWQFGHTPAFEVDLTLNDDAGELRCRVEKAVVVSATVLQGAMPRAVEQALPGCLFRAADLTSRLAACGLALTREMAYGLP